MNSVEFQQEVTRLTKDLTDVEASIMRSVLQNIIIGQLSISPIRLEMAMLEFKKYIEIYREHGFSNLEEILEGNGT